MSGRCSPTQAVNILRREFSAMDSADRLTQAVHRNKCRLYCNGVVIKAHIAARLMVVPQLDNDGRWTAHIVGTFAVGGVKPTVAMGGEEPEDVWEFDVDEVVAMLPPRRGVKGTNWEIHATLEMERLGRKAVLDKHNSGQLLKHLKRVLRRDVKFVPKDDKALPKVIRAFLHGVN